MAGQDYYGGGGNWNPANQPQQQPQAPYHSQPTAAYAGQIYQDSSSNRAPGFYPQGPYQDPRSQPQGYPFPQQYPGGYPPGALDQRVSYEPPENRYPSPYQASPAAQQYVQDAGDHAGPPSGPHESDRGLGTHIVGAIGGRKAAKKMDLGPVATMAAGFVGAQMLSKAKDNRKHKSNSEKR